VGPRVGLGDRRENARLYKDLSCNPPVRLSGPQLATNGCVTVTVGTQDHEEMADPGFSSQRNSQAQGIWEFEKSGSDTV
jgi:hypothetical protein